MILNIDLHEAESWTAIKIHPAAVAIMLKVFQRMFVGKELSRNPEWVSSVATSRSCIMEQGVDVGYTQLKFCTEHSPACMAAAVALTRYPWFLRPIVAPFVPQMRELKRRFNKLVSFVEPIHNASPAHFFSKAPVHLEVISHA
jgi:hypothetical protein